MAFRFSEIRDLLIQTSNTASAADSKAQSTSNVIFRSAQAPPLQSVLVNEQILPSSTLSNVTIGASNQRFKEAWIDELHLSTNTLYLGDTPILGTEQDTVTVRADPDQSILVKTTGLGISSMSSQMGVTIATSGLNSVVDLFASGSGGSVSVGAVAGITLNAPSTTITSNMTVNGNLTVNGTQFTVNTQTVEVRDNILVINSGQVGSGVSAGSAGFTVDRGDAIDYQLLFDETDDKFKLGPIGTLSAIATEAYVGTALSNYAPGATDASNITTGVLAVARGGTGTSTSTGAGSVVLSSNPTFTGTVVLPGGSTVTSSDLNSTTIRSLNSIVLSIDDNNNSTNDIFHIVGAAATKSLFYIGEQSGNVGVGTSNPAQRLDVVGSIAASCNVTVAGTLSAPAVSSTGTQVLVTNASGLSALTIRADAATYVSAVAPYIATSGDNTAVPGVGSNARPLVLYGSNIRYQSRFGPHWMWGNNVQVGGATLSASNLLSVAGNASIGSNYADVNAPAEGLIVSGTVGIGTSNPAFRLDVTTTSLPSRFNTALGTGSVFIEASKGSYYGVSGLGFNAYVTGNNVYNFEDATKSRFACYNYGGQYFGWEYSPPAATQGNEVRFMTHSNVGSYASNGAPRILTSHNADVDINGTLKAYKAGVLLADAQTLSNYQVLVQNNVTSGEACGVAFASGIGVSDTHTPGASIVYERTGAGNFSGSLHFKTQSGGTTNPLTKQMTILSGGNIGCGTSNPTQKLHVIGNILASGTVTSGSTVLTSDDRVKTDEAFIENAMATLNKLRPQVYTKWGSMEEAAAGAAGASGGMKESGLIAQEVFYDAPELRHLVVLPSDADSNALFDSASNITSSTDPSLDPAYPMWGSNVCSLNYTGLIGYLVKAVQEKDAQIVEIRARLSNAGF
jgi:hypothetical protein